ncbi:hypothetical protein N7462_011160 [Penicillium macrosclerotiorum]|uniref:uncharacterized protein n=1 Tax=Penicillium macrosclerotiorum TaxID=303699 RepID=UPI0025474E7E|nr:uncharacterized protein N7462_011160 [Penicillium macrosclerotiorum]KAJ5666751.1 hypothetical protein N7462_011160 [Penicillium macrosclerotiorum]
MSGSERTFEDYFDLGVFSRFIWSYSFNHDETFKCFEKAIELDPSCALAYWDLAYAAGLSWEELESLPLPSDQVLYYVTTTMTHYGKVLARAGTGNVRNADQERVLYHKAAKTVPSTRKDFPNLISDILKVASTMLDGEIEYHRGDYDRAFESLLKAIHYDDSLHHTELWGWIFPTRHFYGDLMAMLRRPSTYAENVGFDSTLTRAHRNINIVWVLHGYHECLLHRERDEEARIIKPQLELAKSLHPLFLLL